MFTGQKGAKRREDLSSEGEQTFYSGSAALAGSPVFKFK